MNKKFRNFLILTTILIMAFLVGPKPNYPKFDNKISPLNISINDIESYINTREENTPDLKPDNNARIIWSGSVKQTEYAVVYIHGFSASQAEGMPIHTEFAKRYGCNLYINRLPFHGVSNLEAFGEMTPKSLVEEAKEAIQIGKILGKKVILMSSSTGSTLSIYLASNNPDVSSLIMYSPNIDLQDKSSNMLLMPWGKQIAKLVFGGDYREWEATPEQKKYWTTKYRIDGLICMKHLIKQTMKDDVFKGINQPTFVGYYFKDEKNFDNIISIDRIKYFYNHISTPENLKRKIEYPNVNNHILASSLWSEDIESVKSSTYKFAEEVLQLTPATNK